jgi:hypothetical protein
MNPFLHLRFPQESFFIVSAAFLLVGDRPTSHNIADHRLQLERGKAGPHV